MQTAEYDQFKTLLARLQKLWPKDLDDELLDVYWRSLRDLPLPVFRGFVERHEKHGRGFPRPGELRPKEDKLADVPGSRDDSKFKEAAERCVRNLEELKQVNPAEWQHEVSIRRLDRLVATEQPGSSMYETVLREWHQLRAQDKAVKP